ncbi:MAG: [protein-PII] uridylyltransferase [Myxococcales bacterium]|nr:[protein-PII] uridylyltransferase [Myxococcales bacterium]
MKAQATSSSPAPSAPLKGELLALRAELAGRLTRNEGDGVALGVANARAMEAILLRLFADAGKSQPGLSEVTLAAVGSFGRGAVALRSDVDLRFLVPTARAVASAQPLIEAMLYPLWDSGASVGHQIVCGDDVLALAHDDLTTATSLLDLRVVAGSPEIVQNLRARAWGGIFSEGELADFIERLEREAEERHTRFGGSVYLLEPDVKSGAGGLRDLDVARWAAQARFHAGSAGSDPDPRFPGPQALWHDLVRLGVLVPREALEIARAEELMWRVRNRLHALADRRAERLTFEAQETLSAELGYGGAEADRAASAERLMQDYYRQARVISRAREQLLSRAKPPRRRGRPAEIDLGGGVTSFDGHVTCSAAALAADPTLALRVLTASIARKEPLLPFAREAIARASADPAFCETLRASVEAARLFVELASSVPEAPTKSGSVLRELHDTGLLLAMIPEFLPVTGRVHHDIYHVYTVDVHSVAAVDRLRALCRGELLHEHPLASRLAAEIARPRTIFLATLLHDVGKGYPDSDGSRKNHSKVGADLCRTILPRLGLSAEETDEAVALVLSHLAMYHTATRRDLDDPKTCEDFAQVVHDREGLRNLYLLTVVDLATTSPTALSSWKARMLDELYLSCDAYFDGQSTDRARHVRIARSVAGAQAAWPADDPGLEAFLASMPERYLLSNGPEAIASHARLALGRSRPVAVAVAPSRHPEVAELCVVAPDRPGLLARISAAITANRLEVLGAQVYSRRLGPLAPGDPETEAVDIFLVKARGEGIQALERALPQLQRDLERVCAGGTEPRELLAERLGSASPWRERPSPAVLTEVFVDDRASPRHTVIEVFAKDRPGLLHTLAQALHDLGLSIVLSKINTEGSKVADVFYVNELDGSKVEPGERFKTIRESLLRVLAGA